MNKAPDAFRSIGEVSQAVGVAPHVLRYWEEQFTQLSPVKRRDGRRYYRPEDVALVAGLVEVLREEGLTIRGAKKLLAKDRGAAVRQRGLVRLGLAEPATESPATPQPAVKVSKPPAGPAAAKPRKPLRKTVESETLPLFPELEPAPAAPTHTDLLPLLADVAARLRDWPEARALPKDLIQIHRLLREMQ
ncbi:MAG: MerR family transcriptional regulator [Paracoccus sp. (in: a-proteobacteria)]|uniref:MerR family transcriptional regulator n=1 Tax=Paracoccus sp. TaxID=267 RepID=UPI0026DF1DC4|nr:MerR family transcriptional regulator [Paracoccus sp. (in: a-proteobacteria)]MDO5621093.1 MerR family transcriptional regulator [Paracoccus sp. (in: a-proteobacteria)]